MNFHKRLKNKIKQIYLLFKVVRRFDLLTSGRYLLNDQSSSEESDKPLAILYGFDVYAQETIASFLPQFQAVSVDKKVPFSLVARQAKKLEIPQIFTPIYNRSENLGKLAERHGLTLVRVDDGFICSTALRATKVMAFSLIFDRSGGIYFDSTKPSGLDEILNNHNFDDNIIDEAKVAIDALIDSNIGRYHVVAPDSVESLYDKEKSKKRILVVGQAEDYRHKIFSGVDNKFTNNDLVRLAHSEHPDAELIYKIHPEVALGQRKMLSDPADVADLCKIVFEQSSVNQILEGVDQVYTFSSLLGFEALLRDIRVTCLGQPFYAGWGLTDDRQETRNRNRRLSKEELFAGAYILYPTYIERDTGKPLSVSETIQMISIVNVSDENEFSDIASTSDYWPSLIYQLLDKGLLEAAKQVLRLQSLRSTANKDKLTPTMANAIAKYALTSFNRDHPTNELLNEIESFSLGEVTGSGILAGVFAYLCIEGREFERFNLIFSRRISLFQTLIVDEGLENENLSDFSEFLSLLYNVDRFLFSFGRFSLDENQLNELLKIVEHLFEKYDSQSADTKQNIENISRNFCNYIIHQDNIYGVKCLEPLMEKIDVHNPTLRVLSSALINNTITREEQMTYRVNLAEKHLLRIAKNLRTSRLLVFTSLNGLLEGFEVGKGLRDPKIIKKYSSLTVKEISNKDNQGNLREKRLLINMLIDTYFRSTNRSKAPLNKALKFTSKWHAKEPKSAAYIKLHIRILSILGNTENIGKLVDAIPSFGNDYVFAMNCSDYFMRLDQFEKGINFAEQALSILENVMFVRTDNPKLVALYKQYRDNLGLKKFYKASAEILSKYPQPQNPESVVFVTGYDHQNTMAMCIPVLCELRRRGHATVYLGQGVLPFESTGDSKIDAFHGIIGNSYDFLAEEHYRNRAFFQKWEEKWDKKVLKSKGINYYQGVFEYLANRYRRFRINIKNPIIGEFYQTQFRKADRSVEVCERIYDEVASRGIKVNILGISAQTAPAYIYKEFCAQKGKNKGMHFYFALNGYENYYSNLGTKVAGTLAIGDMTADYDRRAPTIASRNEFEAWMADGNEIEDYQAEVQEWLGKNRVNKEHTSSQAEAVWQRIVEHKSQGKKIIVVYGKVLCDLGVPYDGGPAHKDMYDWINHTVDSAKGGDTLVLIKPHPHERRPEIARHLTEYLFDLIEHDIPDNVILLDNNWFNNNEIVKVMDLGVLWNGTSSLELGSCGIPVVMCAFHGKFDYPVDFHYPKNRSEYRNIINGKIKVTPLPGNEARCQLLLKYLSTDNIAVEYKYAPRPATNDPLGAPKWFEQDLDRFYKGQDENISKLADKFFVYE